MLFRSIPIRPRKKAPSGGKPDAKKGRNPAAKGKKGKKKKRASLAARLAALNAKPGFRKRRKMFEVVRSDDDARVGTILVFGRRLSLKLLIALAAAVVAVALVFMNNANIAVREESVAVVGLPDDLEDFQLLVISDLNGRRFGDEQSSLLRAINNLDYDALFFLGDMVGAGGDPEPFYEPVSYTHLDVYKRQVSFREQLFRIRDERRHGGNAGICARSRLWTLSLLQPALVDRLAGLREKEAPHPQWMGRLPLQTVQ